MGEHEEPMQRVRAKRIQERERRRLYINVKDKKPYNYGFKDVIDDEGTTTEED